MWVLEGLRWGWTDLPVLVAWGKGKGGEKLQGLEHLQHKLRGFGKAALVLLSHK